jgi:hypothetical protein
MSLSSWLAGFKGPEAQARSRARNQAEVRRRVYVHGGRRAVRALDAQQAARARRRAGRSR